MKKTFGLVTLILWSLIVISLQGCTVYAPHWFENQFNPSNPISIVTDCGPATAANAVCLKSGQCGGVREARKFRPSPLLWGIRDIEAYLNYKKVPYAEVPPATVSAGLKVKDLTLVMYDGVHFKLLQSASGKFTVYDSLFGVYKSDSSILQGAVGNFIIL